MFLLPLALLTPAHAVIYGGNPELTIWVERSPDDLIDGDVDLTNVKLSVCGGGTTTVSVGAAIDPVAGYTVAIPAGNYCGLTVTWGSVLELTGFGAGGAWVGEYDKPSTYFPLASPIAPVALTPFTVTSGVIYGGNPELHAVIQ